MYISTKDWKNYIDRLSALDKRAGDLMMEWISKNGFSDTQAMVDYAYALIQKYGEGSAALSAEMYDAVAEMQSQLYAPAVPASPAGYGEVAKTVKGILKHSQNPNSVANGVSRLVKRTGADTTLNNALRDGAEFAWVPHGDTCAFCITLASRGWQRISKKALKNGHAEHIHANCDCTYAVRFDGKSNVEGYDPQKYADMYYGAEGNTPKERINSLRRMHYEQNKDAINAQKREVYLLSKRMTFAQTEGEASIPPSMVGDYSDFEPLLLEDEDRDSLLLMHNKAITNQFEYGQILYDEGSTELLTDDKYDTIHLPVEQTMGTNLKVYHSHTNPTPPSSADFRPLTLNKVKRIGVISGNGDVWLVEVGDGYRPTIEELNAYLRQLESNLPYELMNHPDFYDWTPEERNYMLIREKLYRTTREYGWKTMGGSIYENE